MANRRRPCSAVIGAVGSKTEAAAKAAASLTTDTTLSGQPDGASHGGTVGATVDARVRKYFTSSLLADKYGDWYEQLKLGSVAQVPAAGNAAMAVPFFTIDASGPPTLGPATTIAAWQEANPNKPHSHHRERSRAECRISHRGPKAVVFDDDTVSGSSRQSGSTV
jgi:hypothetical protein